MAGSSESQVTCTRASQHAHSSRPSSSPSSAIMDGACCLRSPTCFPPPSLQQTGAQTLTFTRTSPFPGSPTVLVSSLNVRCGSISFAGRSWSTMVLLVGMMGSCYRVMEVQSKSRARRCGAVGNRYARVGDLVIEKDRRSSVFWCLSAWKAGWYPPAHHRQSLYPSPWALSLSATGGTDTVPRTHAWEDASEKRLPDAGRL